jgi:hypothetical protein
LRNLPVLSSSEADVAQGSPARQTRFLSLAPGSLIIIVILTGSLVAPLRVGDSCRFLVALNQTHIFYSCKRAPMRVCFLPDAAALVSPFGSVRTGLDVLAGWDHSHDGAALHHYFGAFYRNCHLGSVGSPNQLSRLWLPGCRFRGIPSLVYQVIPFIEENPASPPISHGRNC